MVFNDKPESAILIESIRVIRFAMLSLALDSLDSTGMDEESFPTIQKPLDRDQFAESLFFFIFKNLFCGITYSIRLLQSPS